MIDNDKFLALVEKIDILEELDRLGITGRKSGMDQMIPCPYHDSSELKMGVCITGKNKGLARCLSANCSRRSTIFHIIAKLEGVDLETVLERYHEDWNPIQILAIQKMFEENVSRYGTEDRSFFSETLLDDFSEVQGNYEEYLAGRGFTKDTIRLFGVRCATEGRYANRIIIPVRDEKKRLLGVVARSIIPNVDKRLKVRKTANSSIKSTLFGIHLVKDFRYIVLVEGESDTMTLWQHGMVAGGMGNADLSEGQEKQLAMFDRAYLFLDKDVPKEKVKFRQSKIKKIVPCIVLNIEDYSDTAKDANEMNPEELEKLRKRITG